MAFFAILSLASLASALTLNTPSNWNASSSNILTWTTADGDPSSFSVELLQPQLLNGPLAVVGQANTSDGSITFSLPEVPQGSGYTIQAVAISNITDVLATSSSFSIGAAAPPASTSTSTSTSAASGTAPSGSASTTAASSASSTLFAGSGSGTGTGTSTSPGATSTNNAGGHRATLSAGGLHAGVAAAAGLLLSVGFFVL